MKHFIFLGFVASVVSCAGTETDNPASPLENFSSSACKNKQPSEVPQALLRESDADGLTCVEWQRGDGGALDLKLYNFPEPCGDSYLGTATVTAGGAVDLSVYKDTCELFRCGLCVFDFHFQLRGVNADAPLPLRIGSAVCASEPTTFADELTLPIDTEEAGIVCKQLERGGLEWYARGREACGSANMPCGACDSAADSSCEAGLSCTVVGSNDSRCLTVCESNEDCPAGLTTCQDGVCRAASSW